MKTASLAAAAAFLAASGCTASAPSASLNSADRPDAVQVMVVGTYHFAGSDSDLISVEAGSVRTPERQAELQHIADALTLFDPTMVVVERVTDGPDYIDPNYEDFSPRAFEETENERVQLGYRLARTAGLETVHGIDEQPSEGEPDYFPFGRLAERAEATGQKEALDQMIADVGAFVEAEASKVADESIAVRLLSENRGPVAEANPGFYFGLAPFDVAEDQPAAELQAYWFMRNAKIFSKIVDVTEPGDRVIVIYGAGHKYWLDTFASETPGFVRIDPVPYLEAAAEASER